MTITKDNWRYKWYRWTYEVRDQHPPEQTTLCAMFWTTILWSLGYGTFMAMLVVVAVGLSPIWGPIVGIAKLCERYIKPGTRAKIGNFIEEWVMGRIVPGILVLAMIAALAGVVYVNGWWGVLALLAAAAVILTVVGVIFGVVWLYEHTIENWVKNRRLTKKVRKEMKKLQRETDPGWQLIQGWKHKFCPLITFTDGKATV